MSACIQNLKGVFSPPYSHRMGKKGCKKYLMFFALISATQLNYSFLDLIYLHHFTGLVHNVSLDDIAKLLHYRKIKVFKKISRCSLNQPCSENTTKKGSPLQWPFTVSDPTESNAALQSNAQAVDWYTWPSRDTLLFLASLRPVVSQHLCKSSFETNTLNCIAA